MPSTRLTVTALLSAFVLTLAACNRAPDATPSTPSTQSTASAAASAAPPSSASQANTQNSKLDVQNSPAWLPWSDAVFAQAKRENKCVIMDLEAVWCHWCHVMDEVTYRDAAVVGLMGKGFLAIKVDQDARPDIAARYEKYGWPGTIIFAPDGTEIVKRQGYITPGGMQSLLQAVLEDPTPGPSAMEKPLAVFSTAVELTPDLRRQLEARIADTWDAKEGGWGTIHKYLNAGNLEFCMSRGAGGGAADANAVAMTRRTLDECRKLIDPVWGGLYQYSTDGDWEHPHYERIMPFQADGIRIYARAYEQFHEPGYLQAATDIARFLRTFLRSTEGVFYVSMDADAIPGEHSDSDHYAKLDDAGRRKIGVPRIDQHVYARENGWAIAALVELYQATKDTSYLNDARTAADWIIAHRAIADGGFGHDEHDAGGPYLADTLAMGQAFLALYRAEHKAADLERAHAAAAFIAGHFGGVPTAAGAASVAGVITAVPEMNQRPYLQLDENADTARLAMALFAVTHDPAMETLGQRARRYLATPGVALTFGSEGAVLMAFDSGAP